VSSAVPACRRGRTRPRKSWTIAEGVVVGAVIGLLLYSYTGSRLLAPLLAAALAVFAGRVRWRWLFAAWGSFAAFVVPLGVYALCHPGALTARYGATTIARDGRSHFWVVLQAIANWFHDISPWHWATAGNPAPYVHNGGYGAHLEALLDATRHGRVARRAVGILVVVLGVTIAAQFFQLIDAYRTRGPARVVLFDAGVKPLLEQEFASGNTIYIDYDDRGAQAQARWHAAEAGLRSGRIQILPDGGMPPPAARCSDSSRSATTCARSSRSGANTGLPERLARARARRT
jgi:hypothetical protein